MFIPFNKVFINSESLNYLKDALKNEYLAGDGIYTKKCESYLENKFRATRALLSPSCTASLEMSAILSEIKFGDEIIIPSYTFTSVANAFILRGAVIRFVDIEPNTLSIDLEKIESAISPKTKCIVTVHYAGVSCDMDKLIAISKKYKILLIEDAAHAICSKYRDKYLGTLGDFGCFSFHQTKNISAGEGGAIILNKKIYINRAEIIREKGTNRKDFSKNKTDKYSWLDVGSSYLPSELQAAFLYSQLIKCEEICFKRSVIWHKYQKAFEDLELRGILERNKIPKYNNGNSHIYYFLLNDKYTRDEFIRKMNNKKIQCTTHYEPLHLSLFGKKYYKKEDLSITENIHNRLVRMPLWIGLEKFQDYIIENALKILEDIK